MSSDKQEIMTTPCLSVCPNDADGMSLLSLLKREMINGGSYETIMLGNEAGRARGSEYKYLALRTPRSWRQMLSKTQIYSHYL